VTVLFSKQTIRGHKSGYQAERRSPEDLPILSLSSRINTALLQRGSRCISHSRWQTGVTCTGKILPGAEQTSTAGVTQALFPFVKADNIRYSLSSRLNLWG